MVMGKQAAVTLRYHSFERFQLSLDHYSSSMFRDGPPSIFSLDHVAVTLSTPTIVIHKRDTIKQYIIKRLQRNS